MIATYSSRSMDMCSHNSVLIQDLTQIINSPQKRIRSYWCPRCSRWKGAIGAAFWKHYNTVAYNVAEYIPSLM